MSIALLFLLAAAEGPAGDPVGRGSPSEALDVSSDEPIDAVLNEPAPQEAAPEPEPAVPADADAAPQPERRPPGWWRTDRTAEPGPNIAWTAISSLLVLALLVGFMYLMKRFLQRSKYLAGGGLVDVMATKVLDNQSRLFLVRVGRRAVLVGATRETLRTLSEITDPEEVAVLRAEAGGGESSRAVFQQRLKEGIEEAGREDEPERKGMLSGAVKELDKVLEKVKSWRAS